jgi:hypothetical protein
LVLGKTVVELDWKFGIMKQIMVELTTKTKSAETSGLERAWIGEVRKELRLNSE